MRIVIDISQATLEALETAVEENGDLPSASAMGKVVESWAEIDQIAAGAARAIHEAGR